MLCNRPGRWKATVTESALTETGDNNLVTLILKYAITDEFRDGVWQDVRGEQLEITGYHYLTKKDGAINEFQIKAIKAAFNWNGDPATLETAPMNQPCRITTESSEYNGKTSIKVQFLNHIDDEGGGIQKADDATRKRIISTLGPKLRALGGVNTGATRPMPARAAANVAPAKLAPAPVAPMWDEASAWAEFVALCEKAGQVDAAEQGRLWWHIMQETLGTNAVESISVEQWAQLIDALAGWTLKDGTPF